MVFRVKQASPEPQDPSKLDSPGPDSSSSSQLNDITPPSTSERSPHKALSSPEKSKIDDSEAKAADESKVTDKNIVDSNNDNTREASVRSPVKERDFPKIPQTCNSNKEEIISASSRKEKSKETDKRSSLTGQSTKEVNKMQTNYFSEDVRDDSEAEDGDLMEIDDDDTQDNSTKDRAEFACDKKQEERMEVEEIKSLEKEKEKKVHKDKNMDKNDSTGCTGGQRTQTRESNVGKLSSPEKDTSREEDSTTSQSKVLETWVYICEALGTVRCLRTVVLPPCTPEVLQLLLSNCNNITSVTAADIGSTSEVKPRFDPAYLMEAPKLKEIRVGSTQGLHLTTNFNFIKLQDLKVLVIRGYAGKSWPYLGTNLLSLHLGPCNTFTHLTWMNIGSMTNLRALWLEDGGLRNDVQVYEAINRLTQLRRLCLFNFTVGTKLGMALKKLTKLERVFVLQDSSDGISMGIKNNNMLAVTEHLRFLDELVWAVSSNDIKVISGVDHMLLFSPKVKSYPSLSAKENASDQWPLKLIETVVKRHLPMTKVRIMKLDPAAATRMALSTL